MRRVGEWVLMLIASPVIAVCAIYVGIALLFREVGERSQVRREKGWLAHE